MYLFFAAFGVLFVIGLSIVLNYIYSIFSVNKITKFLNSAEDTIFNKINTSIIPIILWSYIEVIILGTNYYFLLGLILNIFINCAIMYIIKLGYSLISNNENEIVTIVAIISSTIIGFIVNYICLLVGRQCNQLTSVIGIIIITMFYILIKVHPPKTEFFRGVEK